jgi:hypothetical protein
MVYFGMVFPYHPGTPEGAAFPRPPVPEFVERAGVDGRGARRTTDLRRVRVAVARPAILPEPA